MGNVRRVIMLYVLGLVASLALLVWWTIAMEQKRPKLGEVPEIIKAGGGLKLDPHYKNHFFCDRLSVSYLRTEAKGVVVETMNVRVGKWPFMSYFTVTFRNGRPVLLTRNGFRYGQDALAQFSSPQRMALSLLNAAVERAWGSRA